MFRRSIHIFLALALLALATIPGIALLRWYGPEETLQRAQAFFDRGDFHRAINELELNELSSSMQGDPSKRVRLLRLRYAAFSQVDNAPGALRDLEILLEQEGIDEPELQLARIRLLAIVGRNDPAKAELALQRARAFLRKAPDDWRALELAGEAGQTTYRDELGTVFATIDRELGAPQNRRGRAALLAYLYRPDGDPEVPEGLETLRQLYGAHSRLVAVWPDQVRRLADLRTRVQQSLSWFQQSLEAGGEPVAAMRGLGLSLDQSGRIDDLLALCDGYRARYSHQYVFEAGAMAAWAQVRTGEYLGCLATAQRWLPKDSFEQRLETGQLGRGLIDLLLARFVAAWRLGDQKQLEQLSNESWKMTQACEKRLPTLNFSVVNACTNGVLQYLRRDYKTADGTLNWAIGLLRGPVPIGQEDLLTELVPLRLATLRARNASRADLLQVLANWIAARPDDLRPLLAQADLQLQFGEPAAALAVLDAAMALAPTDERVFVARVAAAAELYRDSNQDGRGLLAQCLLRATTVPEVAQPIGFVLCAAAALEAGNATIARESATVAIDKFPQARLPRVLRAKAELLGGRPDAAARQLLQLLDDFPEDTELALLALHAHREANLPRAALLSAALRICPPSAELAAELLRVALADARLDADRFVPKVVPTGPAGHELRILSTHALALAGRGAEAAQMLAPLARQVATLPAPHADELAAAFAAMLVALSATADDATLQARFFAGRDDFALGAPFAAPALLRIAPQLADSHPRTAYAVLGTALAHAAADHRQGTAYALAANLAARLGQYQLAAAHGTAALAFPEGRSHAETLARQCFAEQRPERALQVYRLVTAPTDGALALRAGDAANASTLARAAVARDGADLLAHVVLACLGEPSQCTDLSAATFTTANDPQRNTLLELASLLDREEYGALALPAAQQLATALPDSTTAQLLLARALRFVGQPAMAMASHARLFAKTPPGPLFWREIALAAATAGYVVPEPMATALCVAGAQLQLGGSPVAVAFSLQRTAEVVAKAGNQGIADQLRLTMWQQFPAIHQPTVADAERIAGSGRALDAWWLLDGLRPTLQGEARRQCLERMFALAETLASKAAPELELLCQAAARLLRDEGAYGCVLHFLLDHGRAFPSHWPGDPERLRLLKAHLELAAAGQDPGPWLDRTVDRLVAEVGIQAAASAVDAALAAHPTALPLWRHRATLLGHRQRGAQAAAELRNVLRHTSDPAEQLECLILAATFHAIDATDVLLLPQLPVPLVTSPLGQLAVGLVALRLGRPGEAELTLLRAAPRPDGLHLLALALAQLQFGNEGSLARAQATFARLAQDYPSSSLARYAGSFARQFAPR